MKLSSRCLFWLTGALSLMAMVVSLLQPNPAFAADRVYLSEPHSQIVLNGKGTAGDAAERG